MALPASHLTTKLGQAAVSHPVLAALLTALSIIIAARIVATVRQYNRLRHIKGPFWASLSKLWLVKTVAGDTAYLDYWEVNKRYGPIARIGPNDVLTCDPDLWKHIHAARSPYTRSAWYNGMRFNPDKNNCVSWRDETEHMRLRNIMAGGYSGREVEGLEAKIDRNILALTKLIDEYASNNKPLDFGFKAQYFTLDVISDVAYGEPFGFIKTDSDVYQYISTTSHTVHMGQITTILPWMIDVLTSPTLKKLLPSDKDQLGFGKVMGMAKEVSAERFGPNKKVQKDMLGAFIARGLTQEEAESEILLQIVAGSDTTATAIRATMLHTITNPRILEKFRAEIASVTIDTPVISDSTARSMPYLQALIKEGLRIWPPVTSIQSKQVPPEGDHWKGVYLPGGTLVGFGAWGIFRDQDIWGEDAGEFRPERWLEEPIERVKRMESTLELIFSYGRYQCLGRPIALMELNKIFVHLLSTFDLTIGNPSKPWVIKNPGIFNFSEFWVRAHRRNV